MNSSSQPLEAEVILAEVIRRQDSGENVSAEEVMREHPQLERLLKPRLAKLMTVTRALSLRVNEPKAEFPLPEIDPRYELLREIDHGGQAVVYLARDRETGRNVAVKLLRSGTLADARERARFEREGEILLALEHPNIVSVLDRGPTADGSLYLVMNYVAGKALSTEELAGRPIAERLGLFVQVCRAVDAAHVRGVVHRDLKPSNIRIDDAGQPHVLDFGLAASSQSLHQTMTVTGHFLGTFLWASPEQARGEGNLTTASDVWSLGVILHQLLTGGSFPPQVFAIVKSAIDGKPPATSSRSDADIPMGLRAVLARCLEMRSENRYRSAGEVAAAVEAFLASPTSRPTRWRWPWIAGVVTAVALTGWVALMQWRLSAPKTFNPANDRTSAVPEFIGGHRTLQIAHNYYLVWIPPGEAVLGSQPDVSPRVPDEIQHRVIFKEGFYMSPTDIDCGLFSGVMGWLPPPPPGVPKSLMSQCPVVNVSWADAKAFCERCSAQFGHHVRLPREDEWEYAARAGETGAYPSYMTVLGNAGGDWPMLARYANFADKSSGLSNADRRYDDGYPTLSPRDAHIANAWNLTDMLGNVWVWTGEPYRAALSASPTTQPSAGPVFVSTRGGSWRDHPLALRYSNRNPLPPDFKGDNVGFRIVCDDTLPTKLGDR